MTQANDVLSKQISELAYKGHWEPLLNVLERYPFLINAASEKGYTPLHQAAWHGAKRPVIGKLLRMGADKTLATYNKLQTPLDIALEKNPSRKDLLYLLHPQPRTLSQLMRKMIEDQLIHFQTYDENMVLYERLLFLFNEYDVFELGHKDRNRFLSAFSALTGIQLDEVIADNNQEVQRAGLDLRFWFNQFMPVLQKLSVQKNTIPLEKSWITVADLMFPDLDVWGYRGDPSLWREMRQSLSRVPVPDNRIELETILLNSAQSIMNATFSTEHGVFVKRFSHGGMSSGWISFEFWTTNAIPDILQRAEWLRETWRY